MNKKLTLTIDKDVIRKAKKYSKSEGRSLSELVENFLKAASESETGRTKQVQSTPLTRSMRGSFKEPEDFDYRKTLTEALEKKYT